MLVLTLLPWLLFVVLAPLLLWPRGPRVRDCGPPPADEAPLVSIIVPARDEARNISTCVASLLNSTYPRREIIVVNDGSTDGTTDIVQILAEHADGGLHMIEGASLPAGWLGKPWACWQGYQRASGDLLLFTDADTRHDETLLGHAVGALHRHRADLVSVMPRQIMASFWEKLVQPQIFTMITMRYPDLHRVNRTRDPRAVIANGQFLLMRRDAYEAIGGHEALRGEVVEDQRLAQRIVASGHGLFVAHATELIETRMYTSLAAIVEGWSKNLALGSRQAVPAWLRPATPWLVAVWITLMWLIPPALTIMAIFTTIDSGLFAWSALASALSLLFWFAFYIRNRISPVYALVYPLGALVAAALFVRSALRGDRVEWKGRAYDLRAMAPRSVERRTASRAS